MNLYLSLIFKPNYAAAASSSTNSYSTTRDSSGQSNPPTSNKSKKEIIKKLIIALLIIISAFFALNLLYYFLNKYGLVNIEFLNFIPNVLNPIFNNIAAFASSLSTAEIVLGSVILALITALVVFIIYNHLKVKKLNNELEEIQTELTNKIAQLEAKITELEATKTELTKKTNELKTTQDELKAKITALQEKETELTNKITELKNLQGTEAGKAKNELETTKTELEETKTKARDKIAQLEQSEGLLSRELQGKKDQLNKLTNKTAELEEKQVLNLQPGLLPSLISLNKKNPLIQSTQSSTQSTQSLEPESNQTPQILGFNLLKNTEPQTNKTGEKATTQVLNLPRGFGSNISLIPEISQLQSNQTPEILILNSTEATNLKKEKKNLFSLDQ